MKKFLKIIVILLLIVIILFISNIVRNYFILKNLEEKISHLKDLTSYSVKITSNNEEITSTKNNNIIKIEKSNDDTILYYNTNTNEMIEKNKNTGEKNFYTNKTISFNLNLLEIENSLILSNFISTTKINNEKCYKIKVKSLDNTIFFVSANTGLTLKTSYKDIETVEYSDYKLDNIEELNFEKDNI